MLKPPQPIPEHPLGSVGGGLRAQEMEFLVCTQRSTAVSFQHYFLVQISIIAKCWRSQGRQEADKSTVTELLVDIFS